MPPSAKVYVIDDDPAMRDSLDFLLGAAGFNVRLFDSAQVFLNELASLEVGCVVTDVRMPGIDGMELLRRLSSGPRKLPVIVMTGHGDVPLAVEAMKLGALDFLETLPYVRRDALAATGESGGGTQTFLLAAVDSRVKVAAPVNMISLHMQGGCLCENPPGLRLATTNVEIAATIAPRPLLMVSATGDWTKETLEVEYPAVRAVYELNGAADRVQAVRMTAEHNYNKDSREAMYAWMARWLQGAPADVKVPERSFTVEPLPDLLVFQQRALPAEAVTAAQVTDAWIAAARQQLATPSPDAAAALRHALGFVPSAVAPAAFNRTVLLAHSDPAYGPIASGVCRATWLPPTLP